MARSTTFDPLATNLADFQCSHTLPGAHQLMPLFERLEIRGHLPFAPVCGRASGPARLKGASWASWATTGVGWRRRVVPAGDPELFLLHTHANARIAPVPKVNYRRVVHTYILANLISPKAIRGNADLLLAPAKPPHLSKRLCPRLVMSLPFSTRKAA